MLSSVEAAVIDCPSCDTFAIVGHSLGGALSTLAALELVEIYSNMSFIVKTTGSPRVGNKAFATYYNSKVPNTERLVNNDDTVRASHAACHVESTPQ